MSDKNDKGSAKSSATSPGPCTPAIVPVDTGNESGGETNWKRASATPYPPVKK
jgi:hypothetical protein